MRRLSYELMPYAAWRFSVAVFLKVVSHSSHSHRKTWVMALVGGDPMGFPSSVHHFETDMLVLPQVLHVRPGKREEISPISSSVASSNVPFGLIRTLLL